MTSIHMDNIELVDRIRLAVEEYDSYHIIERHDKLDSCAVDIMKRYHIPMVVALYGYISRKSTIENITPEVLVVDLICRVFKGEDFRW